MGRGALGGADFPLAGVAEQCAAACAVEAAGTAIPRSHHGGKLSVLNALGGECVDDFQHLREDAGLNLRLQAFCSYLL